MKKVNSVAKTQRDFLKLIATTLDEVKERYFICLEFIQQKNLEKEFVDFCNKTHTEK
jgi:hypothetical protein